MNQPVWQIRKQMCEIGHRIWQKGFCAGNEGNHSVRIAEDRVLCTPTGVSKGFMLPDDICVVDMQGNQVEPNAKGLRRTSEILVHLAIYKKRPDVKAVIHSHPPHATAFAVANIPLPESFHPEAEVFLGKVRTAKYATPSTQALPDSILPLIDDNTNTVLMGNHGSTSFSSDLIDTYHKLEILDAYCRILLLCKQVGRINQLDKEQMTELLEVKQKFGMSDPRLACAPQGCVGQDNEAFLATFDDVQPVGASCDCNGGQVQSFTSCGRGDDGFESLVQEITNDIMATNN